MRSHCITVVVFLLLASISCVLSDNFAKIKKDESIADYISTINEEGGLNNLTEGDIAPDPESVHGSHSRKRRAALRDRAKLWPGGIIPYSLHYSAQNSYSTRNAIQQAINEFHSQTCLRFVLRNSTNLHAIIFYGPYYSGCWSYVGKQNSYNQIISIGYGCASKGIVIHEILHALGFYHEQSRPDRDLYVRILLQNIASGTQHNFAKRSYNTINSLGAFYDYDGLMHYGRYAFSRNGLPTIEAVGPNFGPNPSPIVTFGQRVGFSRIDLIQIWALYQCSRNYGPVWSPFSNWSPCDLTCQSKRLRYCHRRDSYQCPGANQHFIEIQSRSCNSSCRVDGSWSSWSNWTACSSLCEDGTRSRNRSCTNPAPINGGRSCVGPSVVTQHCWSGFCNPTPDDCDFENSQNRQCHWKIKGWSVIRSYYPSTSYPTGDHTKNGAGWYVITQPYNPQRRLELTSKLFPSTPERTIKFFYNNLNSKLRVLLNDSITERELWISEKNTRLQRQWMKVEIPYHNPRQYRIIFEASTESSSYSYNAYAALDDIHFVEGGEIIHWTGWSAWSPCDFHCNRMRMRVCLDYDRRKHCPNADLSGREIQKEACSSCSVNCDFDEHSNPMCHWTNGSSLARPFRRIFSPSNPSTGPTKDTSKSGLGYYLLASGVYGYQTYQVRSRWFPKTRGAKLSFYYYVYGYNGRHLRVFIESGTQRREIWRHTGYKTQEWIKVVVEYYSSHSYYVLFDTYTSYYYGRYFIAIDDISFADVKTASVGWSIWSSWSICSTYSCSKTRDRFCIDHVDHKSMCPGVNPVTNVQVQSGIYYSSATAVRWSNWTEWTSCDEYGTQRRERYCLRQVYSDCPGANSHGAQEEQRECANELCTGDCDFEHPTRPFCNWENVPGRIPFRIRSGSTPSNGTGPMEPERNGHGWMGERHRGDGRRGRGRNGNGHRGGGGRDGNGHRGGGGRDGNGHRGGGGRDGNGHRGGGGRDGNGHRGGGGRDGNGHRGGGGRDGNGPRGGGRDGNGRRGNWHKGNNRGDDDDHDDDLGHSRRENSVGEDYWEEINHNSKHTGKYLYMDSSYWLYGSVARLRSKLFSPADQAEFVFSFYMYGKTVNFLKLYILINGYKSQLFEVAGDQGQRWHTEHVVFCSKYPYRLMFEAAAGLDYRSDIAIDDFELHLHDVDGEWSEWGSWSNCTAKCVQTRERTCTEPRRQNRGKDCVGERTESRNCTDGKCFLSQNCSGTFYGANGTIMTPNYPNHYPNNIDCNWTLTVAGNQTGIRFLDFELEHNPCIYDYVQISGGQNTARLCGINGIYYAQNFLTSTVTIRFHSDSSVTRKGFKLFWSNKPVPTLPPRPTSVPNTCGGSYRGASGSFATPNYPSNYGNSLRCEWTITVQSGNIILLTFADFSFESCCDRVIMRDGGQFGTFIAQITGTVGLNKTYTTASNVMFVQLITDYSVTRKGFLARWRSSIRPSIIPSPSTPVPSPSPAPVCGGMLFGVSGTISSPNFPSFYTNNLICTWSITAVTGHVISLNFTAFTLERCCDYVTMRNGGGNGSIIARINGRTGLNQIYISTGREMFVSFTTDGSVVQSGFRAFWRSIIRPSIIPGPSTLVPSPSSYPVGSSTLVPSPTPLPACRAVLSGVSGTISSPNFPSLYTNNLLCTWSITAVTGHVISLNFTSFSLEACCDYVTMRNDGSNGPIIARINGVTGLNQVYTSTGRVMFVSFTTDGSVVRSGFHAFWRSIIQPSIIPGNSSHIPIGASAIPRFNSTVI